MRAARGVCALHHATPPPPPPVPLPNSRGRIALQRLPLPPIAYADARSRLVGDHRSRARDCNHQLPTAVRRCHPTRPAHSSRIAFCHRVSRSYHPIPTPLHPARGRHTLSIAYCDRVTDQGVAIVASRHTHTYYVDIICRILCLDLIRRCESLTAFDLGGCSRLTESSLLAIAASCAKLQSLDIGACKVRLTHSAPYIPSRASHRSLSFIWIFDSLYSPSRLTPVYSRSLTDAALSARSTYDSASRRRAQSSSSSSSF